MESQFDEKDLSSYYFKEVKKENALAILMNEKEGTFLLRDSSRGGYVICIKENPSVMEYFVSTHSSGKLFIRPEFHFKDLPALLSFYKRNIFTTSALIAPVSKEAVFLHMHHSFMNEDERMQTADRRTMPSSCISSSNFSNVSHHLRISAPPVSHSSPEIQVPLYAKVVKAKTPISYDQQSLTLKVGDIIMISRRSNGQGYGTELQTGKTGHFPLTHVELLKNFEKSEQLDS